MTEQEFSQLPPAQKTALKFILDRGGAPEQEVWDYLGTHGVPDPWNSVATTASISAAILQRDPDGRLHIREEAKESVKKLIADLPAT